MVVTCPHCKVKLKIKEELLGRRARCPACKEAFKISLENSPVEGVPDSPPPIVSSSPNNTTPLPLPPIGSQGKTAPAGGSGRDPSVPPEMPNFPPLPPGAIPGSVSLKIDGDKERLLNKWLPTTFGLVLVCFFLPFTHISCEGERVASLSGVQLSVGTSVGNSGGGPFGSATQENKVGFEPMALLGLLCAVSGLGINIFLKTRRSRIGCIAAGGIGILAMILLRFRISHDVLAEGGGILQVHYGSGFYLAFLGFLAAVVGHILLLRMLHKRRFG